MDYPPNLSEADRHWFDLIQECRTSGKSDRQWLAENNIASPTFYYHIKQLRKKSCEIPANTTNCVPQIQEVVPLVIEDIHLEQSVNAIERLQQSAVLSPEPITKPESSVIKLTLKGVTMEITNSATQSIIQNTIAALQLLC